MIGYAIDGSIIFTITRWNMYNDIAQILAT